jgi:hypothetical protein
MGELMTIRKGWTNLRSVVSTALDWPTATNSYNPATTVTHRLASRMVDKTETALVGIKHRCFNAMEIRARLTGSSATATFYIFGRRAGDESVKLVASVSVAAGTQVDENGYYFATTLTVTSYWPKTIIVSPVESGTGMTTLMFDTMGWDDFWVGVTALSAGTIYFDYAGL